MSGAARPHTFTSAVAGPAERGHEFGSVHARKVAATVACYRRLFATEGADVDMESLGDQALRGIDEWAPELGAEIGGIAAGAGIPVGYVAALNARTEILAVLRHEALAECSTVVALGGPDDEPIAMQNWDWYKTMADNWLQWTIPHPDGRRVTTVTEYGIVGKIGINERGVGVNFNILHHRDDGAFTGVPVHIVSREILDTAGDVETAWAICGSATVSASTSITVTTGRSAGKAAISVELWPGGPGRAFPTPDGLLLRTNHFLTSPGSRGDTAVEDGSDTHERYDDLRRLAGRGRDVTAADGYAALTDHTAGVCCHPNPLDDAALQYETLATVRLDFANRTLATEVGPPCRAVAADARSTR